MKYKPVERKVRPVPTTLPEDLHIKRRFPEDPLLSLTNLPTQPLPIQNFGERLTRERWEALRIGEGGFLMEDTGDMTQNVPREKCGKIV
ncbi:hypothetical protein K439DRAFT_1369589 [Ramaria rubella]|nr:hypothetical protein K439DRAFT_1369589 [Ramaria rubella]